MSTSRTTRLSEPTGSEKISIGTLGYVRARHRQRAYDLVIREFKRSGITRADLARRLGKGQDVISRLLSRPQNWELDTLCDLVFAISGTVPAYGTSFPLSGHTPISNVDQMVKQEPAPPVRPQPQAGMLDDPVKQAFFEEFQKQTGSPIPPPPLRVAA